MHAFRAFVDLLLNAVTLLFGTAIVMTLLLNPKVKKAEDQAKQPGQMAISINWAQGPIDVDLWVKSPDDKKPVGYSNKESAGFNLLRDDLGTASDPSPSNFENAYSRTLPAGQYVANVHCFTCEGPTTVFMEIRYVRPGYSMELLFSGSVVIAPKQERTVVAFRLNKDGQLDGQFSNVYMPLREAKK